MQSPLSALERDLLGYVERLVRASEASAKTLRDLEGRSSNRIGLRLDGLADCVALLIDSQLASMMALRQAGDGLERELGESRRRTAEAALRGRDWGREL